jgi:hypothetical protein
MTITRANVESIIVQRCGSLMSFAGMAVTVAGANASLNDPIGYALRQSGYTVANIASVADADLSSLDDDDIDMLLDYAEFRTLENISGNLDDVDISNGPESEKYSQIAANLEKRMARVQERIDSSYGAGVVAEVGTISYDFAEHNDTDIIDA